MYRLPFTLLGLKRRIIRRKYGEEENRNSDVFYREWKFITSVGYGSCIPIHGSHTWSCLFYRLKVQVDQLVGSAPYFIIFTNDKFSED